jgi:hypothetical protein
MEILSAGTLALFEDAILDILHEKPRTFSRLAQLIRGIAMLTNTPLRFCWLVVAASALLAQNSQPVAIPKGTQISIRTLDAIQSKQAEVGQSYRCTLDAPVAAAGKEIAAKGSDCVLRIVEKKSAGKLTGSNQLQLVVSEIRVGGDLVTIDSEPSTITGKGKGKSTGVRTGIGAAAGAGLGGVFGGGKGAAIGAGAGAGVGAASSALTEGPEIKVASETILTFVIR